MSKIDVVYTLAKAGYSKEEIANLMGRDTALETPAAPAEPAASAIPKVSAAPAEPAASAIPKVSAAPAEPATTVDTTASHDELMALRNRLKVLETVLSVSNTDNVDSLASIVYPRGE